MSLPVIAIVGRPNVGKSTLFNALTRSRTALVYDTPGVTRDRQYGHAYIDNHPVVLIDTGGLSAEGEAQDQPMETQSRLAIREADVIYLVVDARAGMTAADEQIAALLREQDKPVIVVVNKVDGLQEEIALAEFYATGFGQPRPVTASHRKGVSALLSDTWGTYLAETYQQQNGQGENDEAADHAIRVAVVGKPNVGKSTLINRILGEQRVVVYDQPGTTRDTLYIPFSRQERDYTIIDTAGVRRRSRVDAPLEKFSVVKTLEAIRDAHVAVIIIDATQQITDQDLHLIGFAIDAGRGIVVAVNKWDGLDQETKQWVKKEIDRRLQFVTDFADLHRISARHGTNVGHLFASIETAYDSANKLIATNELTAALKMAVQEHQPPMRGGRRIKLKYAHMGGHHPPVIVVHGNQVDKLPNSYRQYLINFFKEAFAIAGTPVRLEVRSSDNPYEGKTNSLSKRQHERRRRNNRHKRRKFGK